MRATCGRCAAIYPGTCRDKFRIAGEALRLTGRTPAIRFRVTDEPVEFTDRFQACWSFSHKSNWGILSLRKADGTPAYQLAVVIDDAQMGITEIVPRSGPSHSTSRQILLYHALGMPDRIPHYYHLPLVIGSDGKRLAKRHGDTRLSYYREKNVTSAKGVALIARWSGITDTGPEVCVADLLQSFHIERMRGEPIVFGPEDDEWLLLGTH